VDCIITDPPYGHEAIPLYEDLGKIAKIVLKPGGSLVVMTGQSYLPEIMVGMGKHLRYQWMSAYLTPGGQAAQLWDRKINTFWKPLLWYVKGEYHGKWIGDVAKSHVNDNDKRFHHWGQSESGIADIVSRFSIEGETVLDPFLGGGTVAVVALALRRKFIGADRDPEAIETTWRRLSNG
jgi:site-specific DNA-methyltransferase (adenine-specific)